VRTFSNKHFFSKPALIVNAIVADCITVEKVPKFLGFAFRVCYTVAIGFCYVNSFIIQKSLLFSYIFNDGYADSDIS
jgi:hypothetical protein